MPASAASGMPSLSGSACAATTVPAAVLTAIWAPELFLAGGEVAISPGNERLLAGAVAIAVAWRWRLTFATILAGLAALHLFHWLL